MLVRRRVEVERKFHNSIILLIADCSPLEHSGVASNNAVAANANIPPQRLPQEFVGESNAVIVTIEVPATNQNS